jgi:hexosaminidase
VEKIFILTSLVYIFACTPKALPTLQPQPKSNKEIVNLNHNIIPHPHLVIIHSNLSQIKNLNIYIEPAERNPFIDQLIKMANNTNAIDIKSANVISKININLKDEAYKIKIYDKNGEIEYKTVAGLQYALQSLTQIQHDKYWPQLSIEDQPTFSYRGMHLDVSRHFFSVMEVKKYIDFLATFKYNRFHWHLTDDQGWRIEIKKYPKLTEIGGFRSETLVGHYNDQPHKFDGKRYGGFYTQAQIKEVVEYASQRSITVIPEIEMPGHALAALSAYPALGCGKNKYEAATKWGVFDDVFCPNEMTFKFLEDVLDEVVSLFPSQYIHIGGDECPKDAWKNSAFCQALIKANQLKDEHELQAFFIKIIQKYLAEKHQRSIIGWDEILEGGLTNSTAKTNNLPKPTIMSWRGIQGGIAAASANHNAIMTPGSHCYFDHYQSQKSTEPIAIGGHTNIKKVYNWHLIPDELKGTQRDFIIGGQANVWTEYIPNFSHVEYMAFARGLAMAEVLWGTNRDYEEFIDRFEYHANSLTSKSINIANHIYELAPNFSKAEDSQTLVRFELPRPKTILLSMNGNDQTKYNSTEWIRFEQSGKYKFSIGDNDKENLTIDYFDHAAVKAKISINPLPSDIYKGNGPISINNGIKGSNEKFGGTEWLGFDGSNANVVLDFGTVKNLNHIIWRFFKGEGQWIYLPKKVEIFSSDDGIEYTFFASIDEISTETKTAEIEIALNFFESRYLKAIAYNYGIIPDGAQGSGHSAWLFVDEIIIE